MRIIKTKTPITCTFTNIPGKDFRAKAKNTKYFLYFFTAMLIIPCILALCAEPNNLILIAAIFAAALILFLLHWGFGNFFNNYIYEEITPGQYRSVLKGEGIGKLSKEEKALLLQHLSENEQEIEIPPHNIKKSLPLYVYIILLLGLFAAMFFAPVKRELVCKNTGFIGGKYTYNCYVSSSSILHNFGKVNLDSVQRAFEATKYSQDAKRHKKERVSQIQFLTAGNKTLSYTQVWGKIPLSKKIYDMNNLFDAGKDFSYNFGLGVVLFWGLSIFAVVILLIAAKRGQESLYNYVVEPIFTPKRLDAILRAEGLKNIQGINYKLAENAADKVDNYSTDYEHNDMRQEFYKQSIPPQEQAAINAEVENLTKQFYNDGK